MPGTVLDTGSTAAPAAVTEKPSDVEKEETEE